MHLAAFVEALVPVCVLFILIQAQICMLFRCKLTDNQTLRGKHGAPQTYSDSYRNSAVSNQNMIFSERELMFMFAICRRP